jgi:hypothetical protein
VGFVFVVFVVVGGLALLHAIIDFYGPDFAYGAGGVTFSSARDARAGSPSSPLASAIFRVEGVAAVFFGSDFITVTKAEEADWQRLRPRVLGAIMEHYLAGLPVIEGTEQAEEDEDFAPEDGEIVTQIKELLDTRVRPAVAGDGGDIIFRGFRDGIVRTLLVDSALGISFGFTATFGLLVGFVIVALTMYSAVLDNLRELGTLKAIGCRNGDLTWLVLVQASVYGLGGSFVGLGLGAMLTTGIRSEELSLVVPKDLFFVLPPIMLLVCATASLLSLRRIRKLEPAAVFR